MNTNYIGRFLSVHGQFEHLIVIYSSQVPQVPATMAPVTLPKYREFKNDNRGISCRIKSVNTN